MKKLLIILALVLVPRVEAATLADLQSSVETALSTAIVQRREIITKTALMRKAAATKLQFLRGVSSQVNGPMATSIDVDQFITLQAAEYTVINDAMNDAINDLEGTYP